MKRDDSEDRYPFIAFTLGRSNLRLELDMRTYLTNISVGEGVNFIKTYEKFLLSCIVIIPVD